MGLILISSLLSLFINLSIDVTPNLTIKDQTEIVESNNENVESRFNLAFPKIKTVCESSWPFTLISQKYSLDNFEALSNQSFKVAMSNFYALEFDQLSYILNLLSTTKVEFEISPLG